MARNTLGQLFKVTSFGESHGELVGAIIDGCPAGLEISSEAIQQQLNRRRPGQSAISSPRSESDVFQIQSGIFEGRTTGAPICIIIPNTNQQSADYSALQHVYRPGHADYTYHQKYGNRDHRGGGRSSARVTAGWVAAGAIAEQLLQHQTQIEILAWVDSVYTVQSNIDPSSVSRALIDTSIVRCPDPAAAAEMINIIEEAREQGDSLGGTITCLIRNCPIGLGEPVFGKIQAEIGHAMLNINAVKGIEFGSGFGSSLRKGSENNDPFTLEAGTIKTTTNNAGGMLGGISNGEDIRFRIAFKPTSSIKIKQETIDTEGNKATINIDGRHDPCVLPRAVPIVESLTAIVLADLFLENKLSKL